MTAEPPPVPSSPVSTGAPTNPVLAYATTKPLPMSTKDQTEMHICSVYPMAKRATRRHSTTSRRPDGKFAVSCDTVYTIPAAPRDSYSILAVYDAMTPIVGWSSDGPSQNTITPGHIPVRVVAEDLVQEWAGQTIASKEGHGPGIGIVAGDIPTPDELAYLRERHRSFCEWLVHDGNDKLLQGKTGNITNIHRLGAFWLLGEAAQQLSWYPKMDQRQVKDCPRCAKQILAAALGCEHCSLDLINWYEQYPHLTPDSHVSQFLENRNMAMAKGPESFASAIPPKIPSGPPIHANPVVSPNNPNPNPQIRK